VNPDLRCERTTKMKVCIIGASGKLAQHTVQRALDEGYEVGGVCRAQSVGTLDRFSGRIAALLPRTAEA